MPLSLQMIPFDFIALRFWNRIIYKNKKNDSNHLDVDVVVVVGVQFKYLPPRQIVYQLSSFTSLWLICGIIWIHITHIYIHKHTACVLCVCIFDATFSLALIRTVDNSEQGHSIHHTNRQRIWWNLFFFSVFFAVFFGRILSCCCYYNYCCVRWFGMHCFVCSETSGKYSSFRIFSVIFKYNLVLNYNKKTLLRCVIQ